MQIQRKSIAIESKNDFYCLHTTFFHFKNDIIISSFFWIIRDPVFPLNLVTRWNPNPRRQKKLSHSNLSLLSQSHLLYYCVMCLKGKNVNDKIFLR